MFERKKKFRQRMGILCLAVPVTGAILAILFDTIFSNLLDLTQAMTMKGILESLKRNGFPFALTALFSLAGYFVLGVYALNERQERKKADALGREITMSPDSKNYGDAHFEEPEEYDEAAIVSKAEDCLGPILGQLDQENKNILNLRMDAGTAIGNYNMLVCGGAGSGKTAGFSYNYCFGAVKRRESLIITDPDGGITSNTIQYFRKNGYVCRVLSLKNMTHSDGWDCMKVLREIKEDRNALLTQTQIFAQTIISNLSDRTNESIYEEGPRALLQALVLFVILNPRIRDEEKNIRRVYEILSSPDQNLIAKTFEMTCYSEDEIQILAPAMQMYSVFCQTSENLRGNIIANLAIDLSAIAAEDLMQILTTDDIDLTLPGKIPCVYYCQFPDSHGTYKFIVSLFFSMLFTSLIETADRNPGGRLLVPTGFLLEEAANIGKIAGIDRIISVTRKRAIAVIFIIQNITQIQNLYRDSWVTIAGNCSTVISLGVTDQYTADFVADRIGETTVEVETNQISLGLGGRRLTNIGMAERQSRGIGKRMLLSPDELFRMKPDRCLVLLQYHGPILAYKFMYWNHPDYQKLSCLPAENYPGIQDREGRKKIREEENKTVNKFLKLYPPACIDRSYKKSYRRGEKTGFRVYSGPSALGLRVEKNREEESSYDNHYESVIIGEKSPIINERDKTERNESPKLNLPGTGRMNQEREGSIRGMREKGRLAGDVFSEMVKEEKRKTLTVPENPGRPAAPSVDILKGPLQPPFMREERRMRRKD